MTNDGFYRRRRGLGEHLQSGRISLFDSGVHDFLCMNAQSRVGTASSTPPGVWIGSARKIWLLTDRQDTERRIQRSLQKLERIRWIKRWRTVGRRGDYPILIARFVVTDLSGRDFIVDADATTNWRNPALKLCGERGTDASVRRHRAVSEASPFLQDLDTKIQGDKERTSSSEGKSPSDQDSGRTPARIEPSEAAIGLARLLQARILENNPKTKLANGQEHKWAVEADLMMRIDRRTADEIREVLEWCQRDLFWRTNVLSMGKLRAKFDQLTLKKQADGKGGLTRAEQRARNNLKAAGFLQ